MAKREAQPEHGRDKKAKVEDVKVLLESVTLDDLLRRKRKEGTGEVITLEHNASLGEALEVLASYNILSAPVLTGATVEEDSEGAYIGMVDARTLLHSFVHAVLEGDMGDEVEVIKSKWDEYASRLLITAVGMLKQ